MAQGLLAADADTFPKLLARSARAFGNRPAYREKEFGLWQSWTWAEAGREIRALSLGLEALGLRPGDSVAIIGRNRPYLYWSMVAAQACGAIRFRSTRTRSPRRWPLSSSIAARVTSSRATRSRSTRCWRSRRGCPYSRR